MDVIGKYMNSFISVGDDQLLQVWDIRSGEKKVWSDQKRANHTRMCSQSQFDFRDTFMLIIYLSLCSIWFLSLFLLVLLILSHSFFFLFDLDQSVSSVRAHSSDVLSCNCNKYEIDEILTGGKDGVIHLWDIRFLKQ